MKFIRNGKVKDRIIDAVAKGILIAFSALVCLWMISGARAASGTDISEIRQQAQSDGSFTVDFLLSKPVAKEDVSIEYQRNFIQVSLKNVSAYPARTQKINHDPLEKVFTYQYQPDMARARVLLKSEASAVQSRSTWEVEGKRVRITLKAETSGVAAVQADSVKTRSASGRDAEISVDPEEQKVRNEIMSQAKGGANTNSALPAAKPADFESTPIFAGQSNAGQGVASKERDANVSKIFASLLLVIGLIVAGSLGFRRFVLGRGINARQHGKMIEVLATQTMGPKRSIAVVKVLDQHMVVGMSGDGMSLLSNLGSEVNLDRFMEEPGSGASFTETLKSTISFKSDDSAPVATQRASADLGFRASLKKRLEGFKPL